MAENTQVARQSKGNFSVALSEKLDSITDALPKDLNKARFITNAVALLNDADDKLTKCPQSQIIQGLVKSAVLGLDALNKECYLIPYKDKVNLQLDYRGAVKLAKKYSIRPVKEIYAQVVREDDDFSYGVADGEPTLNHNPKPFNNKPIIGAYAVCLYQDGGKLIDTMSLQELENTRKKSKMPNSSPWREFTGEMYKKTVLHRLCKHIELEFESPNQRMEFDNDVAIETDIKEQVANEIEAEANTVEFDTSDVIDAEIKEVVEESAESEEIFVGTPFK